MTIIQSSDETFSFLMQNQTQDALGYCWWYTEIPPFLTPVDWIYVFRSGKNGKGLQS